MHLKIKLKPPAAQIRRGEFDLIISGVYTSGKLKRVFGGILPPSFFQTNLYDNLKAECYDERTYLDFLIPRSSVSSSSTHLIFLIGLEQPI